MNEIYSFYLMNKAILLQAYGNTTSLAHSFSVSIIKLDLDFDLLRCSKLNLG